MRTRTVVISIAVIVAVVGAGGAALALSSSETHGYRTATAVTGTVTKQLHGSGSIQPVSQATVAFPVSGTVATVNVKLGQEVATGTTLATLDTGSLESTVLSKKAALATAQLNLEKALNGEAVTGGGGGGNGGGGGSQTPTTDAVTTAVVSTNTGDAARAVVTAQHDVDVAMNAVNTALAAASKACGQAPVAPPSGGGSNGGHGPAPSSSKVEASGASSTTTTTTTAPTNNAPDSGIGSTACLRAQTALYRAQQELAAKQQALGQAENGYGQALQAGGNGGNGGGGNGGGGNGGNGSTSVSYSAAQLVAYQSAVDAAAAQVTAAQEAVAQATIKSPITGTVVGLSLKPGQQVTAGSSTDNVVIAGATGYEVATTVGVNDITQVKVGDAATVVPDGSLDGIDGKVVYIGSPTSSGSSTTYPVVIGLTGDTSGLRNGAMATTTIDTATSKKAAVLVPTSAVQNTIGRKTVTVIKDGKPSTVAVQVGVVGAEQTEITSGVDAGQMVALANLGAAVPSSNADARIASQFGSGLTGGNGNRSNGRGG